MNNYLNMTFNLTVDGYKGMEKVIYVKDCEAQCLNQLQHFFFWQYMWIIFLAAFFIWLGIFILQRKQHYEDIVAKKYPQVTALFIENMIWVLFKSALWCLIVFILLYANANYLHWIKI